ncbi:MAG: hypothetical protein JXQ87_06060 [Bacteroidia bacterium]
MRMLFALTVAFISLSFYSPQSYSIRDAYHDISLDYLPVTEDYITGKIDNNENRDKILIYHNEERQLIKLNHSGSKLTGKLKMYTSGTNIFVAIEHTYCRSGKCQNQFVVLKKQGNGFVKASTDVIADYELNYGKLSKEVKKAMKDSYGNNDFFESEGLDDENNLREHIYWEIDEQNENIYLKESSLPFTLAIYTWDEKKGEFKKN